jgi:sphinganine-1-phosphate aldolase
VGKGLVPIPEYGLTEKELLTILTDLKKNEQKAEEGKAFAYSYTSDTDMSDMSKRISQAYELYNNDEGTLPENAEMLWKSWELFMHTNALNPMMYPSLRRMENEIVSMTSWMLNGDSDVAGSLTSGGTESILMAVKAYREWATAARGYLPSPNMVVSQTIHPAFEKAAHYYNIKIIHVATTADFRLDVDAVRAAINKHTILIVGSAPQYCHGVIDPIEELGALAMEKGIGLHVDACFGGFMLPWMERLGCSIPPFDFRVKGVTSMSADIHKYGYAPKGASVVLYKTSQLRSYQYFSYSNWPGGLFVSPSMAGSRSGGIIASTWATMVSTGQNGYMERAAALVEVTDTIVKGVNVIDGIRVAVDPDMTSMAIVSADRSVSILAVAAIMEKSGWVMERQQLPESLHLSVLPQHVRSHAQFLIDLENSVKEVKAHPELTSQLAGVYGMVSAIPDKSIVDDFLIKLFGELFTQGGGPTIIEEARAESKEARRNTGDGVLSRGTLNRAGSM